MKPQDSLIDWSPISFYQINTCFSRFYDRKSIKQDKKNYWGLQDTNNIWMYYKSIRMCYIRYLSFFDKSLFLHMIEYIIKVLKSLVFSWYGRKSQICMTIVMSKLTAVLNDQISPSYEYDFFNSKKSVAF